MGFPLKPTGESINIGWGDSAALLSKDPIAQAAIAQRAATPNSVLQIPPFAHEPFNWTDTDAIKLLRQVSGIVEPNGFLDYAFCGGDGVALLGHIRPSVLARTRVIDLMSISVNLTPRKSWSIGRLLATAVGAACIGWNIEVRWRPESGCWSCMVGGSRVRFHEDADIPDPTLEELAAFVSGTGIAPHPRSMRRLQDEDPEVLLNRIGAALDDLEGK